MPYPHFIHGTPNNTPGRMSTPARRRFTVDEDDSILRWREKKVPWEAIARRLGNGRTVASVQACFRSRLKEPARDGVSASTYYANAFDFESSDVWARKRVLPAGSGAAAVSSAKKRSLSVVGFADNVPKGGRSAGAKKPAVVSAEDMPMRLDSSEKAIQSVLSKWALNPLPKPQPPKAFLEEKRRAAAASEVG